MDFSDILPMRLQQKHILMLMTSPNPKYEVDCLSFRDLDPRDQTCDPTGCGL